MFIDKPRPKKDIGTASNFIRHSSRNYSEADMFRVNFNQNRINLHSTDLGTNFDRTLFKKSLLQVWQARQESRLLLEQQEQLKNLGQLGLAKESNGVIDDDNDDTTISSIAYDDDASLSSQVLIFIRLDINGQVYL